MLISGFSWGDFNLILSQDEKEGGNFGSSQMISMFRDIRQNHNLSDLGFKGDKFTWHNRQDGESNIKARLDRMIATPAWSSFYLSASVVHLMRYASDHLPLWLWLASRKLKKKQYVFKLQRFEECWLHDSGILEAVKGSWEVAGDFMSDKIHRCVNDLSNWSKDRFGDVPNQIKSVQKKLDDLNKQTQHEGVMSEIRRVKARLNDLVESEEIWWAQRSRALWLKHGDKNTKLFHQKASQRKSRNWVECDDHREKFDDEEDIARVFNNFFQDLFSTSHPERITEVVQMVKDRLLDAMRNILEAEFTENEVVLAAKNLKPRAAPGPNGMPALFYQQFWSIVGKDVTSFALKILNVGGNPSNINYTYIYLIPKKKKPKVPGDFRPISLCNVIFKIITKTTANRLKLILPDIIEKFQSAFVPGRLITDNALLAFESFHYMRKKKKRQEGVCGFKARYVKSI